MKRFLIKKIFQILQLLFKLHPDTGDLIAGSMRLSNPRKASFPSENLHFASRVIASGMWNYCFFQFYRHFVGPYWVERQYDPADVSFTPRSISILNINVTHRTWMGFRGLHSTSFALVDPACSISPSAGYFSLEFAIFENGRLLLPTRGDLDIRFAPLRELPAVQCYLTAEDSSLDIRAVGSAEREDTILISIDCDFPQTKGTELIIGIRPFNPEGVAPIHSLEYREDAPGGTVLVNENTTLKFFQDPESIYLSNLLAGDSYFASSSERKVQCSNGIATGVLRFHPKKSGKIRLLARTGEKGLQSSVEYKGKNEFDAEFEASLCAWEEYLKDGAKFQSASIEWNRASKIYCSHLVSLCRGAEVTPGVFTYRQFFFRDAAYMLAALARWNFSQSVRDVLISYPRRQLRSGFFRSQEGEWDSNGQAIWNLVDFATIEGDIEFLRKAYASIKRGANWILRKTRKGSRLMPPGFSAEHLGPADHYYWDNFWSLAGLRETVRAAKLLGMEQDEIFFQDALRDFNETVGASIQSDIMLRGAVPAAPGRRLDSGMIGSISALHPLHLNIISEHAMRKSLDAIYDQYFIKNLFFHTIIHSGYNIYLSAQVAHAYFMIGEVKRARKILLKILKARSELWTYPEAIHPQTGGGVMGDGFHGWAFADILWLMRDFVLYRSGDSLEIFSGLRAKELHEADLEFGPFPIDGSTITIRGYLEKRSGRLQIQLPGVKQSGIRRLRLRLPGLKKHKLKIFVEGGDAHIRDTRVEIKNFSETLSVRY